MYDRHLDTFLAVADSGSFLKASERMFISATALTKQINLLEERLGVKLFERSSRGLRLTPAGELIYKEGRRLIERSDDIVRRARELMGEQMTQIRIGSL